MNDEPVSWKYYLATGITTVIACFLSAVQGEAGIFFRVREILILITRTEVHPLWVFVPAFLLGVAACWVERPKNSRSVLMAGLASFSLFGFTPYTKGVWDPEGRSLTPNSANLVLHVKGLDSPDVSFVIRDADFQVYRRVPQVDPEMALRIPVPGQYYLEVNGGTTYKNVIYPIKITENPLDLDVVLEKVEGWQGFVQKFKQAARRQDRLPD